MKFKTCFFVFLMTVIFAVSNVSANTVTINLLGLNSTGIELGAFQFNLIDDGTYDFPVDLDYNTFVGDFAVTFGSSAPNALAWQGDSLISAVGDIDYARGYSAYLKVANPDFAFNDGVLVTMVSVDTLFTVDPLSFLFFDMSDTPIVDFQVLGDAANIIVDFSAVPIPSSLLLLGGGIFALLGITRRKKG